MRQPIVTIRTVTDLNRVLSMQQIIARKAHLELNKMIDAVPVPTTGEEEEDRIGHLVIEQNAKLLAIYAAKPTFSEFNATPELEDLLPWGQSFAVAALVGEVILPHIEAAQDAFKKEHRRLLTLLMRELSTPDDRDVVEALMSHLKVKLADTSMTPEQKHVAVYKMVRSLAEVMVLTLMEYQLVEEAEGPEGPSYRLTPAGHRVMLHLIDIQRFMEDVLEAHARLRNSDEVTEMRSAR